MSNQSVKLIFKDLSPGDKFTLLQSIKMNIDLIEKEEIDDKSNFIISGFIKLNGQCLQVNDEGEVLENDGFFTAISIGSGTLVSIPDDCEVLQILS